MTQHFHRVYRLRDVRTQTGIAKSSIYELLDENHSRHDPTFPRPFALSARSRGWLAEEVDAWIEAKASNRL